jgi:hypothetical protein
MRHSTGAASRGSPRYSTDDCLPLNHPPPAKAGWIGLEAPAVTQDSLLAPQATE